MQFFNHVVPLVALALVVGCASTEVTDRKRLVHEKLARPGHIWVYDFAATPAEVPAASSLAGQPMEHATPQTPEQIELGRKLGEAIAVQIVEEIRGNMGLPAKRATSHTKPEINDIVIRGYLLSIEEGSATKRVAIGFGSGASELTTAVEGFQMTAQGLRKLGSGKVGAGGGKTPGGALGVATLIATGNPAGLIIGGGMKAYGEYSGSSKIEGRAKATAKEITDVLKTRFQEEGWIA
jgi:uncharacterized protein DUF4410